MQSPSATLCWRGLEELRPRVLRFLTTRCRDEHEAEDLTQETLLRAARYRSSAKSSSRLGSWMVQIAVNVLHDHARRQWGRAATKGEQDDALESLVDRRPVPGGDKYDGLVQVDGHEVDTEDAVRHLNASFLRLFERDRVVLTSYYTGDESTRSTAAECDLPRQLVKVRLFRARRRLERMIVKRAARVRRGRRVVDRTRNEPRGARWS